MTRVRSRDLRLESNTYTYPGTTVSEVRSMDHENCSDDVGYPIDHTLALTRDSVSGNHFDWAGVFYGLGYCGVEVPYGTEELGPINSFLAPFTAQKIAAMTAPERPAVNVITNLLEIREIPLMLKHAGDLILRLRDRPLSLSSPGVIASTTLAYQFGWAPLLQDLGRMIDFGTLVNKRIREIGALNSGKTVRKKVRLGTLTGSGHTSTTMHSTFGIGISSPTHTTWQARAWATIHWQLADWNRYGKIPTWCEAFRGVYGLTVGDAAISVWKALPWSWAIDWFANISDALLVSKNLLAYKPSRINRMCTITKAFSYEAVHPAVGKRFDGGRRLRVTKQRIPLSAATVTGIRLGVPFLDTYKLSVLSALTVVKLRGRRPQSIRS